MSDSSQSEDLLRTRHSLLTRLKHWDDGEGWQRFYETYAAFIRNAALGGGLRPVEADEALQETVISVAKAMKKGGFKNTAEAGSFRSWLLTVTRRRVVDQFRKRTASEKARLDDESDTPHTDPIERIPDDSLERMEEMWNNEWQSYLVAEAMNRAKPCANPKYLQIYDLLMIKGLSVKRIAQVLQVSESKVHLAKYRISRLLRKEVRRLEKGSW